MSIRKGIIKTVIATSIIILVPICLAITGYQLINNHYQLPESVIDYMVIKKNEISQEPVEITPEEVSLKLNTKTLYFILNEENNQIEYMLVELLNCKTNKLKFLTIPTTTKITLSNTLFQKLKETYVSVPQMMKLSMLYQYFGNEDAYTYGMDIVEEAFGVHMDYYLVMNTENYKKLFETNKNGIEVLKEEWTSSINNIVTKKNTKETLLKINEMQESSFSLERRFNYLETYETLSTSDLSFEIIQGEQKNESFVPELEEIKRSILEFCNIS